MTQRQLERLPASMACRQGHTARLMVDGRSPSAGGGHYVECQCGRTGRYPDAEGARQEWRRINGIRKPRATPASNVVQLGLRLTGGRRG